MAQTALSVENLQTADAADIFADMLRQEIKPRSQEATSEVEQAVRTLAQTALASAETIPGNVIETIKAMIAEIDRKMSDQINKILHHPEFQQLERAWTGLKYLVDNTEAGEQLKIRFFNVSRKELHKTLKKYKGNAFSQGPLFKKVYEEEFGQLGGHPYGCLIGDFEFDHSLPDVEILTEMSRIAAAAHAPFIAAAAPSIMQMESWQDVGKPSSVGKIFETPQYAAWRSLRESEDARYLGLTMPRFLARVPYGPKTNPVEEFAFEEEVEGEGHEQFCWANSAYAMGANITRSFKRYGWVSQIRGMEAGGTVEKLPTHTFPTDDGGQDLKCPTEVAISDRREAELAACGFMPLLHKKNTDLAVFMGAQSLQKPTVYDDPDATANAKLAARLPYLFATCRFAHYLKCIVRDKVGTFKSRDDMERWLTKWITNYVDGDPANSSEATKAERPLAKAEVVVSDVPGSPGYYNAAFHLMPHYQLEGLTVALKLVSKLPSEKAK